MAQMCGVLDCVKDVGRGNPSHVIEVKGNKFKICPNHPDLIMEFGFSDVDTADLSELELTMLGIVVEEDGKRTNGGCTWPKVLNSSTTPFTDKTETIKALDKMTQKGILDRKINPAGVSPVYFPAD